MDRNQPTRGTDAIARLAAALDAAIEADAGDQDQATTDPPTDLAAALDAAMKETDR
ncbi:MAG: hypothetical protein LCH77_09775 [Actinobacteria bacterium]|uniref:Uncharacterized protein n=1 Tax=Nostocoides veronense TaxID=330836 RepID=A0ABN2LCJ5_9MICO|nr:hypothetical protein [Actinomycetota bacterium]